MIAAMKKPTSRDDETTFKHEGWIYIGSHNLYVLNLLSHPLLYSTYDNIFYSTAGAWGYLQNSPSGGPQLKIPNHEMGVILPIKAKSANELERWVDKMVTYKRPLVSYSPTDLPWMQFERN